MVKQQLPSNVKLGLLLDLAKRLQPLAMSLPELFRQRLFQPLGLTGMEWAAPRGAGKDNAQGHNPAGQPVPVGGELKLLEFL